MHVKCQLLKQVAEDQDGKSRWFCSAGDNTMLCHFLRNCAPESWDIWNCVFSTAVVQSFVCVQCELKKTGLSLSVMIQQFSFCELSVLSKSCLSIEMDIHQKQVTFLRSHPDFWWQALTLIKLVIRLTVDAHFAIWLFLTDFLVIFCFTC